MFDGKEKMQDIVNVMRNKPQGEMVEETRMKELLEKVNPTEAENDELTALMLLNFGVIVD